MISLLYQPELRSVSNPKWIFRPVRYAPAYLLTVPFPPHGAFILLFVLQLLGGKAWRPSSGAGQTGAFSDIIKFLSSTTLF